MTVSACSSFLWSRCASRSSSAMRLSRPSLRLRFPSSLRRTHPGQFPGIVLPPPGAQARGIQSLPAARALHLQSYSYRTVKNILSSAQDRLPFGDTETPPSGDLDSSIPGRPGTPGRDAATVS